jgi:hypothetical protein
MSNEEKKGTPSFAERGLLIKLLKAQIENADIPDELKENYRQELKKQEEAISLEIKDKVVIALKSAAVIATVVVIIGVGVMVLSGNEEEAESEDLDSSEDSDDSEQSSN